MFTGDRSGDFLYAALWRTGFANQPHATDRTDGLQLTGAYITAAVRCAPPQNRPTTEERDRCLSFSARELALLEAVKVVVLLGGFAWQAFRALLRREGIAVPGSFGHGVEVKAGPYTLLGCYHPSQQNTFTGRLTAPMLDGVLLRARALAGLPPPPTDDKTF
jgi:uracil-DNA glycosylase